MHRLFQQIRRREYIFLFSSIFYGSPEPPKPLLPEPLPPPVSFPVFLKKIRFRFDDLSGGSDNTFCAFRLIQSIGSGHHRRLYRFEWLWQKWAADPIPGRGSVTVRLSEPSSRWMVSSSGSVSQGAICTAFCSGISSLSLLLRLPFTGAGQIRVPAGKPFPVIHLYPLQSLPVLERLHPYPAHPEFSCLSEPGSFPIYRLFFLCSPAVSLFCPALRRRFIFAFSSGFGCFLTVFQLSGQTSRFSFRPFLSQLPQCLLCHSF